MSVSWWMPEVGGVQSGQRTVVDQAQHAARLPTPAAHQPTIDEHRVLAQEQHPGLAGEVQVQVKQVRLAQPHRPLEPEAGQLLRLSCCSTCYLFSCSSSSFRPA